MIYDLDIYVIDFYGTPKNLKSQYYYNDLEYQTREAIDYKKIKPFITFHKVEVEDLDYFIAITANRIKSLVETLYLDTPIDREDEYMRYIVVYDFVCDSIDYHRRIPLKARTFRDTIR